VPTGDPVNRTSWYAGSPESLIGDLVREGVTGAVGYVSQPVLNATIRPQILFPAYTSGFSLVEAFYLAMPVLSWQAVVVGDPLCAPFRGATLSRTDLEEGTDEVTELPGLFSRRRLEVATKVAPGTPEEALALTLRAEVLSARGDAAGAREAIDESLQLAPRLVQAMIMGASLDEAAGRRNEAMEAYRRIVEIDANNVAALNNLAYGLAVHLKQPMEGLSFARRAVAAAPTDPNVLDTLAWIQHLLGDHASAAKLMDEALRADTLNPEIRLHAAIVFAAAGRRPQAQTQLAIALKLNPSLAGTADVKQLQSQLAR
jgi:tetratricopeptide (TPR) repeat protein